MSRVALPKQFRSLFLFLLALPGLATLTPVAGLEPSGCRCCWSCWRRSFFIFRRALTEDSELLERGGAVETVDSGSRSLDSCGRGSFVVCGWGLALAAVMCISRLPWWLYRLVSQLTQACILALASALVAFLTKAPQPSNYRPSSSIHNQIDGLRPL